MKTKTMKSDIIVLLIACNCHSPTALFTTYSYTLPFTLTAVPPNKEAWPYCLLHVRIRTNNRLKSDGAFKAATVSGRKESRERVMVAEVVADSEIGCRGGMKRILHSLTMMHAYRCTL